VPPRHSAAPARMASAEPTGLLRTSLFHGPRYFHAP
jgi:hypothetical protein